MIFWSQKIQTIELFDKTFINTPMCFNLEWGNLMFALDVYIWRVLIDGVFAQKVLTCKVHPYSNSYVN